MLERVRKTRKPVLVTRFGQPVAEVVPPSVQEQAERRLGALAGTAMMEAPLTNEVALEAGRLKLLHHDPADHFLAATARVFGLTLITADDRLRRAGNVRVLVNR